MRIQILLRDQYRRKNGDIKESKIFKFLWYLQFTSIFKRILVVKSWGCCSGFKILLLDKDDIDYNFVKSYLGKYY